MAKIAIGDVALAQGVTASLKEGTLLRPFINLDITSSQILKGSTDGLFKDKLVSKHTVIQYRNYCRQKGISMGLSGSFSSNNVQKKLHKGRVRFIYYRLLLDDTINLENKVWVDPLTTDPTTGREQITFVENSQPFTDLANIFPGPDFVIWPRLFPTLNTTSPLTGTPVTLFVTDPVLTYGFSDYAITSPAFPRNTMNLVINGSNIGPFPVETGNISSNLVRSLYRGTTFIEGGVSKRFDILLQYNSSTFFV